MWRFTSLVQWKWTMVMFTIVNVWLTLPATFTPLEGYVNSSVKWFPLKYAQSAPRSYSGVPVHSCSFEWKRRIYYCVVSVVFLLLYALFVLVLFLLLYALFVLVFWTHAVGRLKYSEEYLMKVNRIYHFQITEASGNTLYHEKQTTTNI